MRADGANPDILHKTKYNPPKVLQAVEHRAHSDVALRTSSQLLLCFLLFCDLISAFHNLVLAKLPNMDHSTYLEAAN